MDPQFGYHATIKAFYDSIQKEGLIPQEHKSFHQPVIFFEESEEEAEAYLEPGTGIMLRFPLHKIDKEWNDHGETVATSPVPPELIQVRKGDGWIPIKEPVRGKPHLVIGMIGAGTASKASTHMLAAAIMEQLTLKEAPAIVHLGDSREEAEAILRAKMAEETKSGIILGETKSKWEEVMNQLDSLFPPEPQENVLIIKATPHLPPVFWEKEDAEKRRNPNKQAYLSLPQFRESKKDRFKHCNKGKHNNRGRGGRK